MTRLRDKRDRALKYRAISLDITVEDIQNIMEYIDIMEINALRAADRGKAQRYVLGLLFKSSRDGVVLIEKARPEWQAGLLNGVDGKVEPGESAQDAMVREFKEETGVKTTGSQWLAFAELSGRDFVVECFTACDTASYECAETKEDERIIKIAPEILVSRAHECVPHLRWLVQMARDFHGGERSFATVRYCEPFRFL